MSLFEKHIFYLSYDFSRSSPYKGDVKNNPPHTIFDSATLVLLYHLQIVLAASLPSDLMLLKAVFDLQLKRDRAIGVVLNILIVGVALDVDELAMITHP